MKHPRNLLVAGVYVDFEERTVVAGGRRLPVTAVSWSEGRDERPGTERLNIANTSPEQAHDLLLAIYKTPERVQAALERPIAACSESVHFNVVCENGWWIEVALWPEDGTMTFNDTRQVYDEYTHSAFVRDLLAFIDSVAARPTFVPTQEEIESYHDDPWAGQERGAWEITWVQTLEHFEWA